MLAKMKSTTPRPETVGCGAGGRIQRPAIFTLLLASLLAVPAKAGQGGSDLPWYGLPWHGREEAIEEALILGEVVHKERIGRGITRPFKVLLEHDGRQMKAIWKPLGPVQPGSTESYRAEIAAYRLSRALGLDMVPPTVERKIGQRTGSLQMWVDGFAMYADLVDRQPPALVWSRQFARMRFFDELIENPDRNAGNFLVGDDWGIVLIDHSQALSFEGVFHAHREPPPSQFDRRLVERVRGLDAETLEKILGDVLPRRDRSQILRQRDLLLAHVDRLRRERGEGVFFEGRSPTPEAGER